VGIINYIEEYEMFWFIFITYIVISFLVASDAKKSGRSYIGFLILSLLLSPIAGIILLAFLGPKKQELPTTTKNNVSKAGTENKRNEAPIQKTTTRMTDMVAHKERYMIHEDIKSLLWFGDGPYKNLTDEQMMDDKDVFYLAGGYKITCGLYVTEPSIIYMDLPINCPDDESAIPRPPYYPKYRELTPEQRYIYLKLLTNPYNTDIDIGYVFILYYGLERHLLQGDFDSAFRVIIKLRDIHKNKSFQYYSGNAIILSSMLREKGEYALEFIKSLDKEYEFGFSDNLFLLCYYSFDYPLTPKDIIRMAKTFEFTNKNYIKKNPDIFEECLKTVIFESTGDENINIKTYITNTELNKLKAGETTIFANSSIIGNTIPVLLLADNFKLKRAMYTFLEAAHEKTKSKIAELRKIGELVEPVMKKKASKKTALPPIDEKYLHEPPKNMDTEELHYFYEEQVEGFFHRRTESKDYLERAIKACENQIAIAKEAVNIVAEKEKRFTSKSSDELRQLADDIFNGIDRSADKYTGMELPEDFNPRIHKGLDDFEMVTTFIPGHSGYKRLCMIRETQGDYEAVINLATQAKSEGWQGDWDKRIERARKKLGIPME
jgi:hypothetical protein